MLHRNPLILTGSTGLSSLETHYIPNDPLNMFTSELLISGGFVSIDP